MPGVRLASPLSQIGEKDFDLKSAVKDNQTAEFTKCLYENQRGGTW